MIPTRSIRETGRYVLVTRFSCAAFLYHGLALHLLGVQPAQQAVILMLSQTVCASLENLMNLSL